MSQPTHHTRLQRRVFVSVDLVASVRFAQAFTSVERNGAATTAEYQPNNNTKHPEQELDNQKSNRCHQVVVVVVAAAVATAAAAAALLVLLHMYLLPPPQDVEWISCSLCDKSGQSATGQIDVNSCATVRH